MPVQTTLCVVLSCWGEVAPLVLGEQCLHEQVASELHTWSPLDFIGFGISCRADEDLGNGSALLENSGFEKEQQISSAPRIFGRKLNILKNSEKNVHRLCLSYEHNQIL